MPINCQYCTFFKFTIKLLTFAQLQEGRLEGRPTSSPCWSHRYNPSFIPRPTRFCSFWIIHRSRKSGRIHHLNNIRCMDTSCLKNKNSYMYTSSFPVISRPTIQLHPLVGQEVCCLCLNWCSSSMVLGTRHKMQQSSLIHAKCFKDNHCPQKHLQAWSRILIREYCPWSLDNSLLRLLNTWFNEGSKDRRKAGKSTFWWTSKGPSMMDAFFVLITNVKPCLLNFRENVLIGRY